MAIVIRVFRFYSYLVHLLLALFMLGVSLVSTLGPSHALQTSLLPWSGDTLCGLLFVSSLCGLASLALAVMGKLRFVFALWATAVLAMVFRGFFLGAHTFADRAGFMDGIYITVALLVAAIGAWLRSGGK